MKLRPILVLLLFVVSAGILAWIYYAATHTRKPVKSSSWEEVITDLDACCRHKHVKSAQYEHFATIADREKQIDAARLFHAAALSERLHEHNCASAIIRLGGVYRPPVKVIVFNGTTLDNLARSIAYERQTLSERPGRDVARALGRNNRYVARALVWAAAGDMRHITLMEECGRRINTPRHNTQQHNAQGYAVCPICGNTYAL